MATVDEALKARLDAFTALALLVGTRNYAAKLPQNATYPATAYTRIGTEDYHAMGADAGTRSATFQLSAFSASLSGCVAVMVQLRAAVLRWRGTQTNGVIVQDTLIEAERGPFVEDGIGDEGGYHGSIDIVVHYGG